MSERGPARPSPEGGEPWLLRRWAAAGTVGGAIATVVMTAYRMPVSRSLPPTAEFWARYVAGGEPDDHLLAALLMHLGYGAAAGTVFGALFGASRWGDATDSVREPAGVVAGALYGLVLSVFGTRVVLARLLAVDLDGTEALVFHVGHVVYGLSLGSWVASRATLADLDVR